MLQPIRHYSDCHAGCLPLQIDQDHRNLWWFHLTQSDTTTHVLEQLFNGEDQLRATRFRFVRDRNDFMVAQATLRGIPANYVSADPCLLYFSAGAHSQPFLPSEGLRFNPSHSSKVGLVVGARGRKVGVNIDHVIVTDDGVSLAGRRFSLKERHGPRAAAASPTFCRSLYECWTRKEDYIKATGKGLLHSLDSLEVTFLPEESSRLVAAVTSNWILYNIVPLRDPLWRLLWNAENRAKPIRCLICSK